MGDVNGELTDLGSLNYDDLDEVLKLQKSQRYNDIMQKVEDALQKDCEITHHKGTLEDDPEYQLILDCYALLGDFENDIIIIHKFIRDSYHPMFSYLEYLVHDPIDYARVVKKIGNEIDLTLVDLEGILPSPNIKAISASTTWGKNPLSEDVIQKTVEACDRVIELDSARKRLLDFVESRLLYIAPNLSAMAGSAVAAKLMGAAGGLVALANMLACDVQRLGIKENTLAGFPLNVMLVIFGR